VEGATWYPVCLFAYRSGQQTLPGKKGAFETCVDTKTGKSVYNQEHLGGGGE